MPPLSDRIIEQAKADFSVPAILRARELSWKAVEILRERITAAWASGAGMSEEEANRLALSVIAELGGEKNWHRPHVRFGENTLLSFRGVSKPGTRLGADDICFVDIGPVFGGYEGDVGDSFVVGSDPEMHRCASDARLLFEALRERWRDGVSGEALYAAAEDQARRMGWRLNLDAAGHRVADFPHHLYYKGSLKDAAFAPSSNLWILEVQIRHPERPFGAFYEDLLF